MRKTIHFTISKGENQYVGECVELPIVTQGYTIDETVGNIKEALKLHLEDESLPEEFKGSPAVTISIDLGKIEYA